jgi:hypothetical protein
MAVWAEKKRRKKNYQPLHNNKMLGNTTNMFLLGCQVQAATCERTFKEFSSLHSKRRANLHNSTMLRITQVKWAIKDKYREADDIGHDDTKNKFVNPVEHERIDVPILPMLQGEETEMERESVIDIGGGRSVEDEEDEV